MPLLVLATSPACRTGSDGDPWASLRADDSSDDSNSKPDEDESAANRDGDRDGADDDASPEAENSEDGNGSLPADSEDAAVSPSPEDTDDTEEGRPSDGTEATESDATESDATESEPECEPDLEVCDGLDNTCDGDVDEGYICPPEGGVSAALGGVPFTGAVYMLGENADGVRAAQKFWPSLESSVLDLVPYGKIRRADNQPFFIGTNSLRGAVSGDIPTPSCPYQLVDSWDFDAAGTLYYKCRQTLYRGDGELVADDVHDLLGVTDDGRAVVRREGYGTVLGHFEPDLEWAPMTLEVSSIFGSRTGVVQGNTVLVTTSRILTGQIEEVILKFDEDSQWSYVRQIATELNGQQILLPDGTLLVLAGPQVIGYLADGSEQIVWDQDAEGALITRETAFSSEGLFLGPAEPADIEF